MTAPVPGVAADCWNETGVGGDASCARLAEHVHCRQCPVYGAAAGRIFERPVDEAYRAHWAAHLRQPVLVAESPDASALVFRVGAEWLAVATALVASVAPLAPLHRLPHRGSGALLGIVNVGGRLTPAVSLEALLDIDDAGAGRIGGRHVFARLLVVDCAGQACALPVAELKGVVRYARSRLAAPAATIDKGLMRHLEGVLLHDGLHVGVLDPAMLARQCTGVLR